MALVITFLFGIANFLLQRAVLESGHPMVATMASYYQMLGGRAPIVLEFVLLLGALLLVAQGQGIWAVFYGAYTAVNALAAWLILTERV